MQKQIVLGLMSPLIMVIAGLVLLRSTRIVGRGPGHLWERLRDAAPVDASSWSGTAGIGQFRPWRRITEVRSFLAQRDTSGEQEWMDLPGRNPEELADMFLDLRRVNRWLGGSWMTFRGLDRLFNGRPTNEHSTILDVASGSADIPCAMSRWARRRSRNLSIIATDINPEVLQLTKDHGARDTVQLVTADALRLPFADDAFDVVACSFFLHHLDPDDVVAALQEMRRVSRAGVLINDMVRSWISYLGAWLFSRIFTRNQISRHDAPLSARRSYTRAELVEMAARAGLEAVVCYGFFGYRVAMVARDRRLASESMQQRASLERATASEARATI